MTGKLILGIAAVALLVPPTVQGQANATVIDERVAMTQAVGRGRVMAVADAKITTGRPYSADAVTETTQVLGDGNRINRQSVVRVYRDGEGRTRREMFGDDGSVRTISIADPVTKTNFTLNPKDKVAFKTSVQITYNVITREGTHATATVSPANPPATAGPAGHGGRGVGGGGGRGVGGGGSVTMPSEKEDPNVKREDLGVQNIEGVMAIGTRRTTTIPAGQIGNAQAIRIISEQWFSDELQLLVMTRHSDPRSGETVYRLRNILRAEPDQSLFTVPADYTIQERGIRQRQ